MKITMRFLIGVSFTAMLACGGGGGGGGGSDENKLFVSIKLASPCRIQPTIDSLDNCTPEEIEGSSYVTDQNTTHLSGTVPEAEIGKCPGAEPFDMCFTYTPPSVQWINSRNDSSGVCDVPRLPRFFGPVDWNTYDFSGVSFGFAEPRGIPLELGPNLIQVTTRSSGSTGNATITITRVVDVTSPTVHHVIPSPGGTYGGRIAVYFSEQLDPASVVNAINVFDINAQPVTGTSEFDPAKLEVRWTPQSVLSLGSSYTARISGVTDWAPNVMIDPYQWSFTTPP